MAWQQGLRPGKKEYSGSDHGLEQQRAQPQHGDVGDGNSMMAMLAMLTRSEMSSMAWQQRSRAGNKKYSGSAHDLDVPPAPFDATDPLASRFVHGGRDMHKKDEEADGRSEASASNGNSDDEETVEMRAAQMDSLGAEYKTMWLFRWQVAAAKLASELGEAVSLPLEITR